MDSVSTSIWRWIFLSTTFGPIAAALISYSLVTIGLGVLITVFIKAYKNFVLGQNSLEIVELGRETIRRGSTLIINNSHKLLPTKETVYQPLSQCSSKGDRLQELNFLNKTDNLSQSIDELKTMLNREFVKTNFCEAERESLIHSENIFIKSEHRRSRLFKVDNYY